MMLRAHWPQILIVWLLLNAVGVTMLHNASRARGIAEPEQLNNSHRPAAPDPAAQQEK